MEQQQRLPQQQYLIPAKHRRRILVSFLTIAVGIQVGIETRKSSIWTDRTLRNLFTQDESKHHYDDAGTKWLSPEIVDTDNATTTTRSGVNPYHVQNNHNLSTPSQHHPLQLRFNDKNESKNNESDPHNNTTDPALQETSSLGTIPHASVQNSHHKQPQSNDTHSSVALPDQNLPIIPAKTAANTQKGQNKSKAVVQEQHPSSHNQSAADVTELSFFSSSKWLLTNQTAPSTSSNDDHNTNATVYTKGVLDLLPWEMQSIRDYNNITDGGGSKLVGVCETPHDGIHDTCCLGSFSGGGSVTRNWAHHCFKDQATYDRVANTVLRQLSRTDHLVDEDCDLCRIVELIQQFDLKFAITGDSMMSQNVDGFFCELLRRGYHVTKVNTTLVDPGTMVGLKEIWTHEITGPAHWTKPTTIQFLFQYRPIPSEIEQIVKSYDVLVMNFGLHWGYESDGYGRDKEGYEDSMTKVLNATLRQGNVTLLAHRETSAQHHNYTAGEWATERTACVPLNRQKHSDIIGWRERVVQAKAQEVGYKVVVADETMSASQPVAGERELVILPFFNLTASLFYLHPDECTHYCSTPYLWMPIWRGLRLAMDRQWKHHPSSS